MSEQILTVQTISLPLNFAVLLNPEHFPRLNMGAANLGFVKSGASGSSFVKFIPDVSCPIGVLRIPESVRLAIGSFTEDRVAVTGFSKQTLCSALQVEPQFETSGRNYSTEINKFMATDSHPVAIGSIFIIPIDGVDRIFKVSNCLPNDNCIASRATKIYQASDSSPFRLCNVLPHYFSEVYISDYVENQFSQYVGLSPELLNTTRAVINNGVIIVGPSGSGKSVVLSAVGNSLGIPSLFVEMKRLLILSVDDVLNRLKQIFAFASEHKQAMLLFDDLECIMANQKFAPKKRIFALFVSLLDKALETRGIIVVATATSRASLDPSLVRYGRFGLTVDIGSLSRKDAVEVVKLKTSGFALRENHLQNIAASKCEGMTAHEIEKLCEQAIRELMKENRCKETDSGIASVLKERLGLRHFGCKENSIDEAKNPEKVFEAPIRIQNADTQNPFRETKETHIQQKKNPFGNYEDEEPPQIQRGRIDPFGLQQDASYDHGFVAGQTQANPFGNFDTQLQPKMRKNPFGDVEEKETPQSGRVDPFDQQRTNYNTEIDTTKIQKKTSYTTDVENPFGQEYSAASNSQNFNAPTYNPFGQSASSAQNTETTRKQDPFGASSSGRKPNNGDDGTNDEFMPFDQPKQKMVNTFGSQEQQEKTQRKQSTRRFDPFGSQETEKPQHQSELDTTQRRRSWKPFDDSGDREFNPFAKKSSNQRQSQFDGDSTTESRRDLFAASEMPEASFASEGRRTSSSKKAPKREFPAPPPDREALRRDPFANNTQPSAAPSNRRNPFGPQEGERQRNPFMTDNDDDDEDYPSYSRTNPFGREYGGKRPGNSPFGGF